MFRFIWIFSFLLTALSEAKVVTEKVIYESNGTKMEGLMAYDTKYKSPRPLVVVYHDWMGNGPYSEMRAKMLAEEGYVAFAADIYGQGQRPKDAGEAKEFATKYRSDRKLLRERALAGLNAVIENKKVNKNKVAAIGYCFGGTAALEVMRSGATLNGIISFHGGLGTDMKAKAGEVRTKVLVLHGADDPFVPMKEVEGFQTEMREAKADWQFISYGNAVHAFTQKDAGTDNSKGAAYNEAADKRSWNQMNDFFREVF